jgi:hypothetical protein
MKTDTKMWTSSISVVTLPVISSWSRSSTSPHWRGRDPIGQTLLCNISCLWVNRHNCRVCGSENPHDVTEHEHRSPKVNVWRASMKNKVVRPFIFQRTYGYWWLVTLCWLWRRTMLCLMSPWEHISLFPSCPYVSVREFLTVGQEDGTHSLSPSFSISESFEIFFSGVCISHFYHEKVQNVNELRNRIIRYGLDDWGSRVRFPVGAGNFSLHHRVQ